MHKLSINEAPPFNLGFETEMGTSISNRKSFIIKRVSLDSR
jgi:hypothetical protein